MENYERLHTAITNADHEKLLQLITEVDINYRDGTGDTPLHWAAQGGNPEIIAVLLNSGANVHTPNNEGTVPLHFAVHSKNPNAVKLFINAGADVNARNNEGKVPLNCAVKEGDILTAQLLIDAGALLDVQDNKGQSLLDYASIPNNPEIIDLLTNPQKGQ